MIGSAVCFFSLITFSVCFDFEWDNNVVKKYTEMKMLNDCFGANFLTSWKESLIEASEKCHGEQISTQMPHFIKYLKSEAELIQKYKNTQKKPISPPNTQHIYSSPVKSSSKYAFMVPQGPNHHANQPALPSFSQYTNDNQHVIANFNPMLTTVSQHPLNTVKLTNYEPVNRPNLVQPSFLPLIYFKQQAPIIDFNLYQSPGRIWWKRSIDDATPTGRARNSKDMKMQSLDHLLLSQVYPEIEILKQRMSSRVSNITCVLKNMELINKDGRPNYEANTELIHRLDIPSSLRNNLLEAQDFCKEFSMCVPIERISNPLVAEVGNSFVFLKCLKKMIFHACMANDFIQSDLSSQFGFNEKSFIVNELKNGHNYNPQDTVRELEYLLESENDIGFGF